MIYPRLASEVRLLPSRRINAAREGPVREPPQVDAGTHREGEDVDCRSDARDHTHIPECAPQSYRFSSRSPACGTGTEVETC
jgi:hypothetical protein